MLLHDNTKKSTIPPKFVVGDESMILHDSKMKFTLHANKQEWEMDIAYFKTMYKQLNSLATKGNLKNGKPSKLKEQLFRMETLIDEDTACLVSRLDALAFEFKSSVAPKLGSIFQEFTDLEEEFQRLRADFRQLSLELLSEINRVCPVKMY